MAEKPATTQRKKKVLEIWVNNPLLSYEEIADMAGITTMTFWRYRQDDDFMAEYKKMCQARFKSMEAKAVELMKQQMDKGNWQAIKYCLDATGYKPEEKVKATVETTTINLNIEDDEE